MKNDIEASIWERIDMEHTLSPMAARALLKFDFPARDHARMRQLSAKARSGTLSPQEEKEIDAYERLGCMLDFFTRRRGAP
jgi:hypothetical protein